jgi:hypothetical protein
MLTNKRVNELSLLKFFQFFPKIPAESIHSWLQGIFYLSAIDFSGSVNDLGSTGKALILTF